jgi:hypothetical protein
MEIEKLEALNKNGFNFDAFMTISQEVKFDLNWWLTNLGHTVAPIMT